VNNDFRIMVVEDSETQALKVRLLLEEQGWQVSVAVSAEAALAALGDSLPDLFLVDYFLPGMHGDEFCRRVRMDLHTRAVPILITTASAPPEAEIQSLESGADDYASKAESSEILLLRIRSLLRKGSVQPAAANALESDFWNEAMTWRRPTMAPPASIASRAADSTAFWWTCGCPG
jgi:two-component system NtrC family sensor kinase